jgi:exodeoxyribonuclease VII small subunit
MSQIKQEKKDPKDFESAMKNLEEIVDRLEKGELTLEESLALFEEGVSISRFCHTRLEEAERKVEILVKNGEGELKAVPFEKAAQDG